MFLLIEIEYLYEIFIITGLLEVFKDFLILNNASINTSSVLIFVFSSVGQLRLQNYFEISRLELL